MKCNRHASQPPLKDHATEHRHGLSSIETSQPREFGICFKALDHPKPASHEIPSKLGAQIYDAPTDDPRNSVEVWIAKSLSNAEI